jgi:hypothetical protein
MKSPIFWDTTPCSPLEASALLAASFALVSWLAYSSTMKTGATCSSESRLTFNGLHGVISQKIGLFIQPMDCRLHMLGPV